MDEKIREFMKPPCRIKPGDKISMNIRPLDLMEVLEVMDAGEDYNIKIRYLNRGMGPFERIYKSTMFTKDNCTIIRKGVAIE